MYDEVTIKILKSPNKLLQDTLLLTPLISLRPFSCILTIALLSFTPHQNILPYFGIDSNLHLLNQLHALQSWSILPLLSFTNQSDSLHHSYLLPQFQQLYNSHVAATGSWPWNVLISLVPHSQQYFRQIHYSWGPKTFLSVARTCYTGNTIWCTCWYVVPNS
jgi:hypothetical protein